MTEFEYRPDIAEKCIRFFEKYLKHNKGHFAGKPFILLPWQREFIQNIYGWYYKGEDRRRYREALLIVPRKSGKSSLIAGLVVFELLFGGIGGEIYAVASSRDQARIIFNMAIDYIHLSPALKRRLVVHKHEIRDRKTRSVFKALSRDAHTALGLNPSFCIYDELLAAPDDRLYRALDTGRNARLNSIVIGISTAGYNAESFCKEMISRAERIEKNPELDPSFLSQIYAIREGEDWESEDVWKRCNPSLGHTITIENLRTEYLKAKSNPRFIEAFKIFYLNAWNSQSKRWVTDQEWCSRIDPSLKLSDVSGKELYLALDLSSTTDLTALAACYYADDTFYLFAEGFIPNDRVEHRSKSDKVPYQLWADEQRINVTPGNCIDFESIISRIHELNRSNTIKSIALDRWGSIYITNRLMAEGFEVVAHGQGFASMGSAIKETERLLLEGRLVIAENPVLNWCVGNVVIETDATENKKFSKRKSVERIDLAVASVMAVSEASKASIGAGTNNSILFSG